MGVNTGELENLLGGPYLWSTTIYCEFFHDVSNLVSKGNKQLRGSLDDGSEQVFGTSDFLKLMGREYWNILKRDGKGNDRYRLDKLNSENTNEKKKSPDLLLKLIRDKYEHIDEYDDTVKEKLNTLAVNGRQFEFFHKDFNGIYQLNKHQFIAFWNSKFPKLVPYLWRELYKVKNELPKYYPTDPINIGHFQNTKLDLTGYVEGLSNALNCDIENGNVFRRFKGQEGCSLEFREFRNLDKVRDKNKVVTMAVNPGTSVLMSVSHSSSADEVMEYIGNAPGAEKLILIFAANFTDDQVWKNCKSFDCRVVIFCDPDRLKPENVENAVAKFKTVNSLTFELSETPIRGSVLSSDKQNWLFEHGLVFVQGREMSVKDMFSNISNMSEVLSGNLLNKLLKREKPVLFGNYKYPEYKGVYIERKLVLSQNENDKRLEHVYVSINFRKCWLSKLGNTQVFQNIKHLENEIDRVKSDSEFILLREHKEISEELMEKCDLAFCSRVVRFIDNRRPCIDPQNSRIAKNPQSNAKARSRLSETEFLNLIRPKNIKTFFFRAASGMGKSKLLCSLGSRIENSLVIFCTFTKFVDILQKNVATKQCTRTDIKRVILEVLGCKDECERNVIDYWLDRKGGKITKVELQLDGLDEVPSKHLKLALKSLKIIENDFDSVRLWVTSNRPFPTEMGVIKFVEWNICRFTADDKYKFFKRSWTGKERKKMNFDTTPQSFSFPCTFTYPTCLESRNATQNDLTDYPLFCSMLAELCQDDFSLHSTLSTSLNLFDLYKSLSKKKFDLMIKQKFGVEVNKNVNDFILLEEIYMQVHKYFALVHLFPQLSKIFTKPSAMKWLTEVDICKMRILTSTEPPTFVHLSYAHFFVVLFIIDGIKKGEVDNLCSNKLFDHFLLSFMSNESNLCMLAPIWELVNRYLSRIQDWSTLQWLENHKKEGHCNLQHSSKLITYTIETRLWDLARLLMNVQISSMDSVECKKILQRAISCEAPLKLVIEMCDLLSFHNKNEWLICSVQNGQYEIAKYLINNLCGNGNKVFDEIAEMRKDGGGIFHCIADWIKGYKFKCLLNKYLDLSSFYDTKEFIMFVQEKNPEEIRRKNNRGQSLLLAMPLMETLFPTIKSSLIRFLTKFLVEDLNVNETSLDGESILSFGSLSRFDLWIIAFSVLSPMAYHETLAFVASKNFAHINLRSKISGLTPLEEAVQLFGKSLRKETLQLFRDLGGTVNELDEEDGSTILHCSLKKCKDIEVIKVSVEHGRKIEVRKREGICALCVAEKERKAKLRSFFREKLRLSKYEICQSNSVIKNKHGRFKCFNSGR